MTAHFLIAILWLAVASTPTPYPLSAHAQIDTRETFGPLKFNADGSFQISIFEDLHFGERWDSPDGDSWAVTGKRNDDRTVAVMNEVLDIEQPDLVVLNGDLISGQNADQETAKIFVEKIVQPLLDRNLTWASTYGNHDSDFHLSRGEILRQEQTWRNCRTSSMVLDDQAGVSNYYLPVFSADCSDTTACAPELLLWFFDSRGGKLYQENQNGNTVPQRNWVDQSVVDWFKSTNDKLVEEYCKVIPSIAFMHIPTVASRLLQQHATTIHKKKYPGLYDEPGLAVQADGWYPDGTAVPPKLFDYGGQDVPFMQALTNTSGLMAVFSAHDHGTTWCARWTDTLPTMNFSGNGLKLCFGQHTGYGGYGSWARGSRQVYIHQDQLADLAIETWIRTDSADGHGPMVLGNVTLNSTYGEDIYTVTPEIFT